MKFICKKNLIAAGLASTLSLTNAYAQTAGGPPTPGFNNKIPETILTPNTVQTRIGTLNFVDGVPTAETTRMVYDHLDFLRGVEVFLNFIPAASLEAIRLGNASQGAKRSNQAVIFDQLLDSNPLLLTGNTDTVYCLVTLDLETDGPTVVEVPPGSGPGTVNDAFFRFVVDMGGPGPDKGKGGKYLIVPPGYKGALPKDGYFVARSPSYVNILVLRGFLVDGKPDAASKMFREGVKVYPLAKAANPPKMQFFNGSKVPYNTVHANNFEFYKELDHVIQKEPVDFIDAELRGLAASIGMRKGKKFAPDERMMKILTDAVAVGNASDSMSRTTVCLLGTRHDVKGTYSLKGRITGRGKREQLKSSVKGNFEFSARHGEFVRSPGVDATFDYLNATGDFKVAFPDLDKETFPYRLVSVKGRVDGEVIIGDEIIVHSTRVNLSGQGKFDLARKWIDGKALVAVLKPVDEVISRIPVVGSIFGGSLLGIPVELPVRWTGLKSLTYTPRTLEPNC